MTSNYSNKNILKNLNTFKNNQCLLLLKEPPTVIGFYVMYIDQLSVFNDYDDDSYK